MHIEDLLSRHVDIRRDWLCSFADTGERYTGTWKRHLYADFRDLLMYGSSPCSPFNAEPVIIKNGSSIEINHEQVIDCSFLDDLI